MAAAVSVKRAPHRAGDPSSSKSFFFFFFTLISGRFLYDLGRMLISRESPCSRAVAHLIPTLIAARETQSRGSQNRMKLSLGSEEPAAVRWGLGTPNREPTDQSTDADDEMIT